MADRVGQQLGNYRLLRRIGQGSFAEVYLGEHLYLERLAAIKVLHVQMDPKTQEQFRREARTIAHLEHPHIVQVFEFGLDYQTPYLVMEYIADGTLRSQHPKGTRLSFEQIVTYVKQIASALDYAHQQRVIHRDIKPDNLLLKAKDEIVLSDFGLAVVQRTLDSLSTQNLAGTPIYMAPEQIQSQPCAASDQYALGIIVYEWLAGEAPFRGPLFEVFSHHLSQPPPSLREHLPDLPDTVEEVVFKALAKDPEHRFACVADFASAFEQACSATQPFTLHGLAQPQIQKPTVSQNRRFVPASPVREQTDGSFSTQPQSITMQQTEQGQEEVSVITPGSVLHRPPASKVVSLTRRKMLIGLGVVAASLATGGTVWWERSQQDTPYTYRGHSDHVQSVVWSPDSTRIASGSADDTVQVWDAATGTLKLAYRGHLNNVLSVAWSPDGTRIASGGNDKTVQVWKAI